MGKFLSRDQIFDADDSRSEEVYVPEWRAPTGEDTVRVKGLTGAERERYEASVGYVKGDRWVPKGNAAARLVVMSVIDEKGQALFSDEDVNRLGRKSSAALKRVVDVCRRLSGLTEEDMDWLEGNSDGVQSEPSSSSSPSLLGAQSPSSSKPSAVAS
jgi:hypothetical protein